MCSQPRSSQNNHQHQRQQQQLSPSHSTMHDIVRQRLLESMLFVPKDLNGTNNDNNNDSN